MRGIIAAAAGVAALFSIGTAHAQTKIGVWTVKIDKDCSITQEWKTDSKDTAVVGLAYTNKGQAMVMIFGDSSWKLKEKEDLTISLSVDKKWSDKFPGAAIDKTMAAVGIPATSKAIDALMNGRELYMEIDGKSDDYAYTYYLDDTRKAISALEACRAQAQ
ncbi:hypothetical protein [Azospirillum sp. TSO35-2]|uniref:hypothetical protein n=1 Tax=Azospirillum sp. TSO35-2 TaxID=716796 RepID=UPI000D62220A|nr:hypothetical protein [Azospirillum sp. TSO35-2]PWC37427.1 hypothetical protein TSO352_07635 [Azospirillum sp. TSO35-2]